MKRYYALAILLNAVFGAYAQVPKTPPRVEKDKDWKESGSAVIQVSLASTPRSLSELVAKSSLVVDGTIQTKLASRQSAIHSHLETDFVVTVNSVLKGDTTVREVMVSELGGAKDSFQQTLLGDTLMQPEERYILFLTEDKRAGLPASSMGHFSTVALWVGKARVAGGVITLNSKSPLRDQFDGMSLSQFQDTIRGVKRP